MGKYKRPKHLKTFLSAVQFASKHYTGHVVRYNLDKQLRIFLRYNLHKQEYVYRSTLATKTICIVYI